MRNVLTVLLAICATTAQAVEVPEAVGMPPLSPGLPPPSELADGTVCLPPALADAVDTQREECRQLKARNQARLDALGAQCDVEREGAVDMARAEALNEAKRGFAWTEVALAGGAGVALGVIVGLLAAMAAGG